MTPGLQGLAPATSQGRSFFGVRGNRILGKGFAQGQRLTVHPAAGLSLLLCRRTCTGAKRRSLLSPCRKGAQGLGMWERWVILPCFSNCPQCSTGKNTFLPNYEHPQSGEGGALVIAHCPSGHLSVPGGQPASAGAQDLPSAGLPALFLSVVSGVIIVPVVAL